MSIVQNVLIGRSKNKIGNAVFTTWKGKNVLKSKPLTVENPRTDAQLMRRDAMSKIVSFYRSIAGIVFLGWKQLAIGKSEYNAFVSYNLLNAFDYSTPPTATLNMEDVLISKGTIAPAPVSAITATNGTATVTVTWPTTAALPGQAVTDKALLLVTNKQNNTSAQSVGLISRSVGTATLTLSENNSTGDDITVWLGFYNPSDGKSSDSVYSDTIV